MPYSDPVKRKEYNTQWNQRNPGRCRAASKRWEQAHPERRRDYAMKYRYGLTSTDYERMYQDQCGRCQICEGTFARLCVDHDHDTGTVRGLICKKCNTAIGFLPSSALLRRAALYIADY